MASNAKFCSQCGHELPEPNPPFCSQCGSSTEISKIDIEMKSQVIETSNDSARNRPFVDSHMALAILSVFLFWLTGFIAVYFASQTNARLKQGDYDGAVKSSDKALNAIKFTFGACAMTLLVVGVVLLGLMVEYRY